MAPKPKALLRDHKQIPFEEWKGLFSRGIDDSVPRGYFIDSLNILCDESGAITRDGFEENFTQPNIRRVFSYKRLNETPRYLILDTSGNLYDSLYPGTPIITNVLFLDFSAVNYLNRAYITFHNRIAGITNTFLYVYEGGGPGTIRFAAGAAPTGFSIGVSTSAGSGNIEAGTHLFAWAYITSSGFVTVPGPTLFANYTAPGNFGADFTAVPIGPSGTVSRVLLATKVIPSYDGNQFGYEFFFVPGGQIDDNTTTTLSGVSFFDDDLQSPADYLFDQITQIPAGLGIAVYNNRLIIWGIPGFAHYAFVSKAIEVESVDETAGLLYLDPSDSIAGIKNAIEFRSSLYLMSDSKTYVTTDNGNNPNTWSIQPVDKAIGTQIFAISRILDSRGANADRFFVGSPTGLFMFEQGIYRKPEISWNIPKIWNRINKAQFNKVQVDHDPEKCLIYCSVPLDDSTECSHMLVADYSYSFGQFGQIIADNVRWHMWTFPWLIGSSFVDLNSDNTPVLKIGGFEGNVYIQEAGLKTDDGLLISSYVQTYLAFLVAGYIHHFGFLSLRAVGSGPLQIFLYGIDNVLSANPPQFTLSATPGAFLERPINFMDSKMSIKLLSNTSAGNWLNVYSMMVDCKPQWAERPSV